MPGQPGQKPSVPRSPNKRVLPASNEPGLWAADGAPRSSTDEPLRILDVPLEVQHPRHPNFKGVDPEICARATHNILANYIDNDAMARLTKEVRACVVADLFLHCSERLAEWSPVFTAKKHAQTADVVREFRKQKCRGQILHADVKAFMGDLRTAFDEHMRSE